MDAKLKRKWLKALRGGQYDQGQNRLVSKAGTEFCCLGVLADVQGCVWREGQDGQLFPIMPRGRTVISASSSGERREGSYLYPQYAGGLSPAVQCSLATMNDRGKPFTEIADYIEREL